MTQPSWGAVARQPSPVPRSVRPQMPVIEQRNPLASGPAFGAETNVPKGATPLSTVQPSQQNVTTGPGALPWLMSKLPSEPLPTTAIVPRAVGKPPARAPRLQPSDLHTGVLPS